MYAYVCACVCARGGATLIYCREANAGGWPIDNYNNKGGYAENTNWPFNICLEIDVRSTQLGRELAFVKTGAWREEEEGKEERGREAREGFNSFRARWKRFRLKTVWSGDFSTWAKFRESAST